MRRIFARFVPAAFFLLLSACVGLPSEPAALPTRPARDSLDRFTLNGRVAILQGSRSNTVRLSWEHGTGSDTIGFASPLGSRVAELQRGPKGATWIGADGERQDAPSADLLITRLTDTPVPIDALALWVTGRTSPAAGRIVRDAEGRLLSADDQGWQVSITAYESARPDALPRNLEVAFPGLRLKLIVEEWLL